MEEGAIKIHTGVVIEHLIEGHVRTYKLPAEYKVQV